MSEDADDVVRIMPVYICFHLKNESQLSRDLILKTWAV